MAFCAKPHETEETTSSRPFAARCVPANRHTTQQSLILTSKSKSKSNNTKDREQGNQKQRQRKREEKTKKQKTQHTLPLFFFIITSEYYCCRAVLLCNLILQVQEETAPTILICLLCVFSCYSSTAFCTAVRTYDM